MPFIGDVELDITAAPSRTDYDFHAVLRMSGGLDALSDPALLEVLDGLSIGRTPEELAALGYDSSTGLGTLTIRVQLPGDVDSTTGEMVDGHAEWTAPFGSDEPVEKDLSLVTRATDGRPSMIRLIALITLVAAVGLAAVGLVRRH